MADGSILTVMCQSWQPVLVCANFLSKQLRKQLSKQPHLPNVIFAVSRGVNDELL